MKANADLLCYQHIKLKLISAFQCKKKLKGNTAMNLDNYQYQCSIKHDSLNSLFYSVHKKVIVLNFNKH